MKMINCTYFGNCSVPSTTADPVTYSTIGAVTNGTSGPNSSPSSPVVTSPELIVELVYLGVVLVLILLGNSLVILAFALGSRRLKTYTNYFVVNLAVSDIMVGLLSLPFWMYVRVVAMMGDSNAVQKTTFYKIFIRFDVLLGTTSILSLTAISVERMFAVKFPARHFNLTWRPVAAAISTAWLSGIFFAVIKSVPRLDEERRTYIIFSLAFMLPTAVIIVSYIMLYIAAKESMTQSSRRIAKEVRIARMIQIIIGLYLFCWLPFFILNIIYSNCKSWCGKIPFSLFYFTKCLHYSNSMMNFFVYALRSPDFRNAFKALLLRQPLTRPRGETYLSESDPRRRTLSTQSTFGNGNIGETVTMETPLQPNNGRGSIVIK